MRPKAQVHADALPGRTLQGHQGYLPGAGEARQGTEPEHPPAPNGSLPCSHPFPVPTSGHSSCHFTSCPSWELTTQMVICTSPPTLGWTETFPCPPSPSRKVLQAPRLPFFRTVLRQGLPLAHTFRECSSTGVYLIFFSHNSVCMC